MQALHGYLCDLLSYSLHDVLGSYERKRRFKRFYSTCLVNLTRSTRSDDILGCPGHSYNCKLVVRIRFVLRVANIRLNVSVARQRLDRLRGYQQFWAQSPPFAS